MSGIAQILVEREEIAQLIARGNFFTCGRLVSDLLALAKSSSAISADKIPFAHFVDLAACRNLDRLSMNLLEILEFCHLRPLSRLPSSDFASRIMGHRQMYLSDQAPYNGRHSMISDSQINGDY
jgi:hypothetical protein